MFCLTCVSVISLEGHFKFLNLNDKKNAAFTAPVNWNLRLKTQTERVVIILLSYFCVTKQKESVHWLIKGFGQHFLLHLVQKANCYNAKLLITRSVNFLEYWVVAFGKRNSEFCHMYFSNPWISQAKYDLFPFCFYLIGGKADMAATNNSVLIILFSCTVSLL